MMDEKGQKNLEKKHPYENFNKQVGSICGFFVNFSRLHEKAISSFP